MKKLLLLIPIIVSCYAPMQVECTQDISGECPATWVYFKTEDEAIRVQRRIARECRRPVRSGVGLELYPDMIDCSRVILGKEYGYIREKYRYQIK